MNLPTSDNILQTPASPLRTLWTLRASDRPATSRFYIYRPPLSPPFHVSSLFTIFYSSESYSGDFFVITFWNVR